MHSLSLFPLLLLGIATCAQDRKQYTVELLMVVDAQAQKNYQLSGVKDVYQQAVHDMIYMTDQINSFFKTMSKNDLNIVVRLSTFKILDKGTILFSAGKVEKNSALSTFQDYLQKTKQEGFDIKMLLTGDDLVVEEKSIDDLVVEEKSIGGQGKRANSAPVAVSTDSNICQHGSSGVSVVELSASQETAQMAAREIAKILGAKVHDRHGCAGHLMSSDKFAQNRWSFSKCTANDIKAFIGDKDCLKNESHKIHVSLKILNISENHDNLDHQAVCRRSLRSGRAYFCGYQKLFGGKRPHGDTVCQAIYCSPYKEEKCVKVIPPEGMICDVNKRCSEGKCVPTTKKTKVKTSDCVFGDIRSGMKVSGAKSCKRLLHWSSRECYNKDTYDMCCGTCERSTSGREDCKWWDRTDCCKIREACTLRKRDCCHFCTHRMCISK